MSSTILNLLLPIMSDAVMKDDERLPPVYPFPGYRTTLSIEADPANEGVVFDLAVDTEPGSGKNEVLNMFVSMLRGPFSLKEKSIKLSDKIAQVFAQDFGGLETPENLWTVVVRLIMCIPPGHHYTKIVLDTLVRLRVRHDSLTEQAPEMRWANLPKFLETIERNYRRLEVNINPDNFMSKMVKYFNLSGFVLRMSAIGINTWAPTIRMIRNGIEVTHTDLFLQNFFIQVACMAIRRSAPCVIEKFRYGRSPLLRTDAVAAYDSQGSWAGKRPLCMGRWRHWRPRIVQILRDPSYALVNDTIRAMRLAYQTLADVEMGFRFTPPPLFDEYSDPYTPEKEEKPLPRWMTRPPREPRRPSPPCLDVDVIVSLDIPLVMAPEDREFLAIMMNDEVEEETVATE